MAPDQSHEYFVRLCALSTSGTLTAEEWKQLRDHLAECAACRETKRQYEAVLSNTVPRLAPEDEIVDSCAELGSWSPERAEAALMRRLAAEQDPVVPGPVTPHPSIYRWKPWRRWGAAAAMLLVSTAFGYWAGIRGGQRSDHELPPTTIVQSAQPPAIRPDIRPGATPVISTKETDSNSDLRSQLRLAQLELAKLTDQRTQLEQTLDQQRLDLDHGAQERADLDKKLAGTQANLQALQEKLDLNASQNLQETAQSVEQESHVNELRASLRERDQKVAQDEQLLEHDRDIRNLMGARDLYIAEIYDVAKTGDTQKPFGRVFYTKGKSLVFYAYDLDQQPGVKRASIFQAWGRTGSDTKHDRNLGVFYQDDINKQRWILKSNDAKTLSQIDAVFVTVEPSGESVKPSGKPVLFTYLRLTPNHP